ncbi:MAG: hypothetical protein B6I37_05405 [Desulfobacteraceae bacterium 4572_35.2]|nr:MAG: hypothetical protein B6I37_05405 [Desulfobacteraceae bacterium 4572_35.2]
MLKSSLVCVFLLLCLVTPVVSAEMLDGAQELAQSGFVDESYDDLYDDLYADDEAAEIYDPLEGLNRGTFWFNDKCYFYLVKPLARGFRVVPTPVRKGLAKMFDNLNSPIRAINCLLQGQFCQFGKETTRLVVNSTLGVVGFFDAADHFWQIKKKDEDFGQTLGYYGVGEGFYVVIPLLGASNIRDGLALVPDSYADPIPWLVDSKIALALTAGKVVNRVSLDKDTYESIVAEQLDPYLFTRDAYVQNRRAKVID